MKPVLGRDLVRDFEADLGSQNRSDALLKFTRCTNDHFANTQTQISRIKYMVYIFHNCTVY